MKKRPQTSFACITADDTGKAYAGGANSFIYVWNGNTAVDTIGVHERGFVGAIIWRDGILYSGGKDGRVNLIDTNAGYAVKECFTFPALIRAIDVFENSFVVGLRTGSIVECDRTTK